MASKTFEFCVETAFGSLPPLSVKVPEGPMRLADIVPFVHKIASDIVALAAQKSAAEGLPVSCKAGCGTCCYQLIPLSAPEAIYCVEYLLSLPLDKRAPLLEGFECMHNRITDAGLDDRINNVKPGPLAEVLGKEYFEARIPCPFLAESCCSIHSIRPIACREHNVVSDPALCQDPFSKKTKPLGLQRHLAERLQALTVYCTSLDYRYGVMPGIFDWYDNNRSIAARTWPGPELFSLMLDFIVGQGPAKKS